MFVFRSFFPHESIIDQCLNSYLRGCGYPVAEIQTCFHVSDKEYV